jgi:SAM-dependent methyltransferase
MDPNNKPFSQPCENNKDPILAVLREVFVQPGTILEIGSGTGQHAVHFGRHLPHLTWQPTDVAGNLAGIEAWLAEAELANVATPLALDLDAAEWPVADADGAFSANTAHIVSWEQVERLFSGLASRLAPGARFCLYGPFAYAGQHTSDSNAEFDATLRRRDPHSGIRDVADLRRLARDTGFVLAADHAMPANNRTLVWERQ